MNEIGRLNRDLSALNARIIKADRELNIIREISIDRRKELDNIKIDNTERIRYLEMAIASIQKNNYIEIEDLNFKILLIEKELIKFQQYNRRESIEISGLPEDIPQNELERICIGILRRVGVLGLESYEIAACHRLKRKVGGEKMQRVIIRFINRKRTYNCLEGRKHLNDTIWEFPGIYFHESLCHKYKDLYDLINALILNQCE